MLLFIAGLVIGANFGLLIFSVIRSGSKRW